MSVRGILSLALWLPLAACTSSTPATSLAPSRSSVAVATLTSEASTTARPSVSVPPSASRGPATTGAPARTPAPALSVAEQDLVGGVRDDLVDCVPRRTDLPPRAIAGVECRANSDLIARVGIYGFRDDRDAALTYFERLADAGVTPNTGQCSEGKPGDRAWTPGDGEGTDEGYVAVDGINLVPFRSGCFHDVNGNANFRATCGYETYVGILGATRDIAALETWAWTYPEGAEADTPSPPGICNGQMGGLDEPD